MGSLAVGNDFQIRTDKLVHGVGYALLGVLVTTGLSAILYIPAIALIIVVGIALEYVQGLVIQNRHFELNDIFANTVGLIVGCLIGLIICAVWTSIRRSLIAKGERRRLKYYQDGEVIFRMNDASDFIYVIRKGEVKLSDDNGNNFAIARPEEVIGEMGVIEGKPRSATATAVGETVLYRLDSKILELGVDGQEHPGLLVARVLAKRLRESNQKLIENSN
jgi:hypothetical protein